MVNELSDGVTETQILHTQNLKETVTGKKLSMIMV